MLARVGGDRELLAEISRLFVDDAPRHLDADPRRRSTRATASALRRAAHGLKGAAANFDADAVVAASRTLEEIGRTQPFDADHLSEAAWQSLADETERLISSPQDIDHIASLSSSTRSVAPDPQQNCFPPRRGTDFCTTNCVRHQRKKEGSSCGTRMKFAGKSIKAKGKIKESVGELNDDEQLRNEGIDDQAAGNVEEAFGKGRRKVGEAVKDLGNKIGR